MTRPDLTLVHGWGMHRSIWSPCLDALRVVANVRLADLPGYGGTPDVNGAFADAVGLTMDGTAFGMGKRGQRFSMIVNDGVVEQLNVEAPGEFKVSSADHMLEQL